MKTTIITLRCRVLTTALLLGACNSDEVLLASAGDSQGGSSSGSTGTSASGSGPVTGSGAGSSSDSLGDSEAGSDSQGVSQSGSSASATETATATGGDTDGDTEGASATASATESASGTGTESGSTSVGDTDSTAGDTDAMCDPDLPKDSACQMCMAENCCEAYTACLADNTCQCLVSKCSAAPIPVTCALTECDVIGNGLPKALMYLQACSQDCNVTCPLVGLL